MPCYSGKDEQDQNYQEKRLTSDNRRERDRSLREDDQESPDEGHAIYDEEHAKRKCFGRSDRYYDACK